MGLAITIALTSTACFIFRRAIARVQAKNFMTQQVNAIQRVLPDTLVTESYMAMVFERIGLVLWCIMALGSGMIAVNSALA
jgi:hypothetical protein